MILGADMMQRAVAVPAAIVLVIQGFVILFVVAADLILRKPELLEKFKGFLPKKYRKGGETD
nr:hypothetical protein [Desulforamulus aquiferis]